MRGFADSPTLQTLAVMGVVFVVQQVLQLVGLMGFFFVLSPSFFVRPWSLVTSVYAHANLAHLLGNALVLLPVGLAIGLAGAWQVVLIGFALTAMFGTAWNVVTVSLRQSVIPDRLLGRVNSVYRFLAWGSIPIGAAIGGVVVAVLDGPLSRDAALRAPWIISGVVHIGLLVVVLRRLSTAALDSIRSPEAEA